MLVETFLLNKINKIEPFQDSNQTAVTINVFTIVLIVILGLVYTFGAVILSWNYSNYVGSSFFTKIVIAILALIFPSAYYPIYAWFLNPLKFSRINNISLKPVNK